jgi:hypothetical protein
MKIDGTLANEIAQLVKEGATCREIAKLKNLHRTSVERVLRRLGIKVPKGPRPAACDGKFFANFTPESCYWGGMMLADGYVRKDRPVIDLHLKIEDRGHLEKFKAALKYEGNLSDRITVTSPSLKLGLEKNFGVVPQKTPIAAFPDQVPKQFHPHLIRGIFDGDGCPTYPLGGVPMVSFVGTVKLLEGIQTVLHRELSIKLKSGNDTAPIQPQDSKEYGPGVFGAFWYSGRNAMLVMDWMYRDSTPDIRLDRKYALYLLWKNM